MVPIDDVAIGDRDMSPVLVKDCAASRNATTQMLNLQILTYNFSGFHGFQTLIC